MVDINGYQEQAAATAANKKNEQMNITEHLTQTKNHAILYMVFCSVVFK